MGRRRSTTVSDSLNRSQPFSALTLPYPFRPVHLRNTTYTREDEALELRTQLERLEGLLAILDSPVEDDSEEQGHRRKVSRLSGMRELFSELTLCSTGFVG